jgi:penicillin V acylase-like amidase (Ntn superfamily)
MKRFFRNIVLLLALGLLGACSVSLATPIPATPTVIPTATISIPAGFTENQARTLASLKQVDEFPLYTMRYYGEYDSFLTSSLSASAEPGLPPAWACSLFTVLLDEDHLLYGRNFDWEFSPALLLFTDPPDGYASVSMVDLAPSKINRETLLHLTDTPLGEVERRELLYAALVPYDGMNEHGLAIAMAAVTPGNMQADRPRRRLTAGIIRQILDHARDVDEAVEIITGYNIDFTGGPPLHYLIADAQGKRFGGVYRGEMHISK